MYENKTFDVLLSELLDIVRDDVDKREGAVIYDALAPVAAKLAEAYIALDNELSLIYPEDAAANSDSDDDALDKAIAWSNTTRKEATAAVLRGEFKNGAGALMDIEIGSRFSIEDVNYVASSRISTGVYAMTAETVGEIGNQYLGSLTPIDYINGLGSAELTSLITAGTDLESNQSLLDRYYINVRKPITSGNIYQYQKWALEVPGVGEAHVIPTWAGNNTVKVVILDDNKRSPSAAIVNATQMYIDPTQDGAGEGAAPIGARVTVVGAQEVPINISVKVELASGSSTATVKAQLSEAVTKYLEDIAFGDDKLVRITRVAVFLLDIPPVRDYSNLTINGQTGNIEVTEEQVAVLGTVNVYV